MHGSQESRSTGRPDLVILHCTTRPTAAAPREARREEKGKEAKGMNKVDKEVEKEMRVAVRSR